MSEAPRDAFRLNAPGDFYVENNLCLSCGAPEHIAPDLMSHVEDEKIVYHCYFKRQPQDAIEVEQAIQAVRHGCCGAVRYRGHDPQIIARLNALGSHEDSDHEPID